jgi:hypothetical protein
VLKVRRLNPNWLKLVAGAIAIVGVSISAIRLVSFPSGEQPSYQIASTPAASEKESIPPVASFEDKSEDNSKNTAKVAASPKSANQITPTNPNVSKSKPNAAIAPRLSQPQTEGDRQPLEKIDKVAIAPEPNISKSSNRQRVADNLPSAFGATTIAKPTTQSRSDELLNKDASQPSMVTAESSPSTKLSIPAPASRAANGNIATNIKVLQIQSKLPNDITTELVRYIQDQQITPSETGTIVFNLEISGDRIITISTDSQVSTLKDNEAIAELEKIILNWRSPNPVTGKIRLILQL